ncbi:MAG TPA: hypothetical protein VFU13_05165 [Steroidobacteraceae bacterium]|nr:hypothetical protein [Steroidobacteraceae bacterium]
MKQLRSIRLRSCVLPILLGALALRFLIPAGPMPGSGDSTVLSVSMCSTDSRNELLEIPSEPAKPHCDHCTLPSLDAPLAPVNLASLAPDSQPSLLPSLESQLAEIPLLRAQNPRGPPHS